MHAVTWIQIGIMRDPGPEGNFFYLFSIFFLASGGRSPSLPRDFTVYTVTLLVLRVFHCERCRIRTRDHCLRRLERYQGKKLSEICKNVLIHPNLSILKKKLKFSTLVALHKSSFQIWGKKSELSRKEMRKSYLVRSKSNECISIFLNFSQWGDSLDQCDQMLKLKVAQVFQ